MLFVGTAEQKTHSGPGQLAEHLEFWSDNNGCWVLGGEGEGGKGTVVVVINAVVLEGWMDDGCLRVLCKIGRLAGRTSQSGQSTRCGVIGWLPQASKLNGSCRRLNLEKMQLGHVTFTYIIEFAMNSSKRLSVFVFSRWQCRLRRVSWLF